MLLPIPPEPIPPQLSGQSGVFTVVNNDYTINDPRLIRERRFLDRTTGRLHNTSYQPYANNLSAALLNLHLTKGSTELKGISISNIQFIGEAVRF